VQIYSLTNGYHRRLMLKGLPQGKWMEGNVDMRDARKPDGTGGPLSEDERIDDIQFYCDPRAEMLIDDIVLYDAAEGEKRPFPKRILFTAWFDTGKQGKEWPGSFEIAQKEGYFWHAAKSVPHPDRKDIAWIKVGLRGGRPVGDATHLSFMFKLSGAESMDVRFNADKYINTIPLGVPKDREGKWTRVNADLDSYSTPRQFFPKGERIHDITFMIPRNATLLIDDLLLHEPGKK
jgi:hypothetical protein